jgi:hypothetical protein
MSWRARSGLALAAVVGLAALLVGVARWEHRHEVRREAAGFRIVERLIGRLDDPSLSGFRRLPSVDCLTYRRGANRYALELCVDPAGRVVEAIDRRRDTRRIWSLTFDPASSTVRVDRGEVDRLLRRMIA